MKKDFYLFKLLLLIIVISIQFILSNPSKAQESNCPLSLSVSYAPIQQLSLSDIDFEHFESRILIFTLQIKDTFNIPVSTQLIIEMDAQLLNGNEYKNALYYKSKSFNVFPGMTIITNLDFGKTGKIQSEKYELSNEAKTNIQDVALATGKFPAGYYKYRFKLINSECGELIGEPPEVKLFLDNPTRVELRSPRDGEFTTEFPLFEFFYNGDKAELLVTEKKENQTLEDAITNVPWMNKVDLYGQNSFLYSGGRPLEQGKTYVWRVISKTVGTGGIENQVSSPIWTFTVSPNQSGIGSAEDAIMKIIEEMFKDKYPKLFQQIHDEGFVLTGVYNFNNSSLSQGELLSILNEIRQYLDEVELTLE